MNKKKENYSISFSGDSSNIQIQQNVSESQQHQEINKNVDYKSIEEILDEIARYKPMFAEVYGENSEQATDILDKLISLVKEKEEKSIIQKALGVFKDLTLRVSSSLLATGILGLIAKIMI